MKKILIATLSFLTILSVAACGKKSKNATVKTAGTTISEKNSSNEDNDIIKEENKLTVWAAKDLINTIAESTGEAAKNVGSMGLVFSVDGDLSGRNLSANVGTTRFNIGNASAEFNVDADLDMQLDRTNKIAKITYDALADIDCNISPKGNVVSLFDLKYNGSAYGDLYIQEKNDMSYFYTTFDISSDPNTSQPLIGGYQKGVSDEYLAFTGIEEFFDDLYTDSTVFDFSYIEDWEDLVYKKDNTVVIDCKNKDLIKNVFDFGSEYDDFNTLTNFFGYGIKIDKIIIEVNNSNEIIDFDVEASIDGTLNLALIDVTSNKIYNILKEYDEDLADFFRELDEYDLNGTVDFDLTVKADLTVGYESKTLAIPSKYNNATEYEVGDFIDDWFELPHSNRFEAIHKTSGLACDMRYFMMEYYYGYSPSNSWWQKADALIDKGTDTYSLTLNNYIACESSEYYTIPNPFDSTAGDGGMTVTLTLIRDTEDPNYIRNTVFNVTVSGTVGGYTIVPRTYGNGEQYWSGWEMFYIVD